MRRYSPEETASLLDMSTAGLRRYEKEGAFIPLRTPTGRKYYTEDMIQDLMKGVYKAEEQDKYTIIQEEPVRVTVNISKLVKINSISLDNVSYYQIPKTAQYASKYDVLEVRNNKLNANITYTLGRINNEGETPLFEEAIVWVSNTL